MGGVRMGLSAWRRELLFFYLLIAAWQDYRSREIDGQIFVAAAVVGALGCGEAWFGAGRTWTDILLSCGIGIGLLGLGRMSSGGIGEGDGWFFVISGLYLHMEENLAMFLSGLWISFFWSLSLVVKAFLQKKHGRVRELPFLPCLLPFGIWLAVA